MLLRPAGGDAVVAVGQASHAWVSGQMARAWGNDRFPAPEPREEVCLGALQHDVGMAEWDLEPELDPDTGWPVPFYAMDRFTHLALWTRAPQRLLTQSAYAALLTSLHGTGLYERFPPRTDDPEVLRAVDAYLTGQRALQAHLIAELRADPVALARNRALLAAWDTLSLALCHDDARATIAGVPAAGDTLQTLTLRRDDRGRTLDPWPFAAPAVALRAEGRRLEGSCEDRAALAAALRDAPVIALHLDLHDPSG